MMVNEMVNEIMIWLKGLEGGEEVGSFLGGG